MQRIRRPLSVVVGFLALVVVVAFIATQTVSCASLEPPGESELDATRASMVVDEDNAAKAAAALPPGKQRDELVAHAELVAAMRAELDRLRQELATTKASAASEVAAASTVAGAIPVPGALAVSTALGGIGGALWPLLRSQRIARALRQVVEGFEKAKAANPTLAAQIQASEDTLHSAMDLESIAIVRGELRKARRVPDLVATVAPVARAKPASKTRRRAPKATPAT